MNKIKIGFQEKKPESFLYDGTAVLVYPYLSLENQQAIMANYVAQYFSQSSMNLTPFDLMNAEYGLILNIIDVNTNIMVMEAVEVKEGGESIPDRPAFTMNSLFESPDLWENIKLKIKNYDEFRRILDKVVLEIKEQRAVQVSVGNVIDSIYENITAFISGLVSTEITDENIGKLKALVRELGDSPIIQAMKAIPETSTAPVDEKPKRKRNSKQ